MTEENRIRNRVFTLRLLEEESVLLDAKADEAEMSKSEYIRNMILFGAAHERTNFTKEQTRAILYELNRIGNNINQIAYSANVLHGVDEDEFQRLIFTFKDLLGQFEELL